MSETLKCEIIEKELIDVKLYSVDFIPKRKNITDLDDINISSPNDGDVLTYDSGYWKNLPLDEAELAKIIFNEVPTKINVKRFQLSNAFVSGKLVVYLNGIKEKNIVIIDSTNFELPINSVDTDTIEVNYISQ